MPDRNENADLIFTSYDIYVIDLKEIFLDALKFHCLRVTERGPEKSPRLVRP